MNLILENLKEFWIVYIFLAMYTSLMAHHAYGGHKQTRGISDYYIGGRKMGGLILGLSFFATYSSTNSFVGFSGQAYSWGTAWFLLVPFLVGFSLFSWIVVAPRLRIFTRLLDSLTIPDFIGFRFESKTARIMASFIVIFASLFYMTAVFKGIGNLLETFMDIPYKLAIIVIFFIVVAYTATGGFISVVKTDAVQGIIMSIAAVLLFIGTVNAAGGLGSFYEIRQAATTSHLFTWNGGVALPMLFGVLVSATIKMAVEPRQLARFYALEDAAAVRRGMMVSTLAFTSVYLLLVPIGIYAHRVIGDGLGDTDLVVPTLLVTEGVFFPVVSSFLLVAMVAAAMSSLDSVLLVMASTTERDIRGLIWPTDSHKKTLTYTKFYVVLFAAITAGIALNPPGSIVALTALSGSMYAACFLPSIVLGLYWSRGNSRAVIGSFVTGLSVLFFWPWTEYLHQVFPAIIVSSSVYTLTSIFSTKIETKRISQLFIAD
ncbi:MAG: sodium/solute symporter [Longimicrobiales bacterium]|nr:sodium/solute symporter [Longimicrobiales bacterium]